MNNDSPMETSPGPEAQAAPPPLPNLAVRVVQVFVSPAALFDRLKENPAWLGALLLIIGLGLGAQLIIPSDLVREAILARLPENVPPDAVEGQIRFANAFRFIGTVLISPIVFAILAGVLLLLFNVFGGGEASFKQLFSAAIHSNFVVTIGGLFTLPLMLAARDLELSLSLRLLAPFAESGTYLYRFLGGLNIFGMWATVVLGIAVSRIYPRRSAGGAGALLLGLYVLLKAIFAIFGGRGG
ncbi:MAG: YIP1 family protein [Gemmatimonadota bacterium]